MKEIDLHCHLDGSLSRSFVEKRLNRQVGIEELQVEEDCDSLNTYLEKFDLPGQCLQDEEGLKGAAYDILESMKQDHVGYAEIRFAPLLHVSDQMPVKKVLEAVLDGMELGRKAWGVEWNVIVCCMRHHSFEENYEMVKTARDYLGNGICGVDLAGAEALYPMCEFLELFRKVKQLEMPFTIHAGECGNVQNIQEAIEAGAKRIGHGIAMTGKTAVKELAKRNRIGIEMCPISNYQTKAVKKGEEYPMREFLDAGILATLNTDNRTVSNTTLAKEKAFVKEKCHITEEDLLKMRKNAIEIAFADDKIKHILLTE